MQHPGEFPAPPAREPGFAYQMSKPTAVMRRYDGRAERRVVQPRQATLPSLDGPTAWTVEGSAQLLHAYVRRATFDRVVVKAHGADPERAAVVPRFGIADALLEQLALALLRAARDRPPGHAIYADCLAQALAAHLVQRHSTLARPPRAPAPDGLTDRRLRRLADDLSLDDLAAVAGLSPLYLARAFRRAFGEPPHRYVVGRRVERAKALLAATDLPLAEVALACGFGDQSGLSRAFRARVGTSPGAYRTGVKA